MNRKLPNLLDKLPRDVSQELRGVFNHVYDLIAQNMANTQKALERPAFEGTVREQAISEAVGLLGAFAQPLAGDTSTDSQLDSLGTNSTSITSISVSTSGNLSGSASSGTAPVITLAFSATPAFTTVTTGGARFVGYTTSIAAPSVTEMPNDLDFCVHEDTGLGRLYFAFNRSGVIYKVQLT